MISNTSSNDDTIINQSIDYILLFRLIVWGYVGMILSLFGIIGNIITILVLISSSMRTTSTNIYLTALSCSNILFLLIFIPNYSIRYLLGYSVYMSNQPPFALETLLIRLPTTPVYNTILLSIIYLTIAVSMDRLILIKFPLNAKYILTRRTTLITIFFIYVFSILYCIPYWLEQRYEPELKQCVRTAIGEKIHKYIRIYIYIPVVYVIPFLTLTFINITIIQNLLAKKRHKESLVGKSIKRKTADNHITLMLVTVVIVFVLSQFPLLVLNAWYAIDPIASDSLKFQTLNSLGVLLIVLNTSTNFLLYCFFGQKFRRTLIGYIFNLCPNHFKKPTIETPVSPRIQLSLQTHQAQQQRQTSRTSSTTTCDFKLVRTKSNEQFPRISLNSSSPPDQIPIRTSYDESRPLLSSTVIHIEDLNQPFKHTGDKSPMDSNKHLSVNEKQILTLKI